jgi:outer membrane protein OmpA-like peptidoglycan-associated protein/tetratricopeptide (TPR) repeat protein
MNITTIFKKILLFTISLITFLSFQNAYAQLEIEKGLSNGKLKARGDHARKVGDLYSAVFYYEEVCKNDSSDIEAFFQMAELYQLTRNYSKSEVAYAYVLSKSPGKYPYALYDKAIMQKMLGKYEEAESNLILFRKETRNLGDKAFKNQLGRDIAGCDSGASYRDFPDNVNIENIGNSVNHPHVEFSPLAVDTNNILFGSLRIEKMKYYENEEQAPRRQVYKAVKTNNIWEETGLEEVFNDPNMDMGNFVYAPISDRYYFTKCEKTSDAKTICKLYFVERINNKWSNAQLLPDPINLDGFTSTQPCIMYDTINKKENTIEYLYYVSDRADGKGGLDVWSTYYNKAKKEWVKPANVVMMNTTENECTPYFHVPTQTFYFSSTGHTSAGGYDIFKIVKTKTRYSAPQNMSFPINSPQDDLDYKVLTKDGKKGFLVSNRVGSTPYAHETCCDDIFRFTILPVKPFECKLQLKIVNIDSTTKSQQLFVNKMDAKTKKVIIDTVNVTNGEYTLALEANQQYTFKVTKEGTQPDSLVFATREMSSSPIIEKTLTVKPIEKEDKYELITEVPTEGKAFVLNDIQYSSNSSDLSVDALAAIDSLLIPFLKIHPKDKVNISSHTDDIGSTKFNLKLSQQRADKVIKYLISKGIPAHRLHAKGLGESKPIAPNTNADGSPNLIGQSINRRTEFLLEK